jgi:arabinogalactan endo-1,4-beta-galactosidase
MIMLSGIYTNPVSGQPFYFGVDLSYVNEMEACGAVYFKDGTPINVVGLFKDNGANLARFRLWHTPSWYDSLNQGERYSDFEDVRLSISRAKTLGFAVLLDFHLSDTWADPGHQVVPAAWASVVDDQNLLADSLYNYIYQTLFRLGNEGLLPNIVQIGNETNRGILLSQETNDQGWSLDWTRNVFLFQAAASAIDDAALNLGIPIQKAIHIADPADVEWYIGQFVQHGFTNFDIIGISYYWQWHQPVNIAQTGQVISSLKEDYPEKKVMIFETAYGWTTENADNANNILFNAHPSYSPLSPSNQKKWMTDLTQEVIDHGGSGVVYWEPAWVSTGCETQWVTGSSWDNATFFDHDLNVMEDGGIGWMMYAYDFTSSTNSIEDFSEEINIIYDSGALLIQMKDASLINIPLNITLYSMEGRTIYSDRVTMLYDDILQLTIPPLVAGCYLACVYAEDSGHINRIITTTNH